MSNPLNTDTVIWQNVTDHIAQVTLNRPDVRNAVDLDMIAGIEAAVARCNENQQIKVLIMTGEGKAFCSGGNVKDMHTRSDLFEGSAYQISQNYKKHIQRIPLALDQLEVPLIAAVNGPAYGAGCDLAMMADLRVAVEGASFAESFIKLGIIPGDGGAWFLPRVIGYPRAAELLFTGKPITAVHALEWGMVNRVVDAEELLSCAQALAEDIACNPAHSVRMTKQLLKESERASLSSLLASSRALQAIAHHTDDHQEAVTAFLERRSPSFTGN